MSSPTAGPVRLAMIGGGEGAFIGAVHRAAARLDGALQLVAGAFSRDHANTLRTGAALGLDPARCYASWESLLAAETALPPETRAECIAIVTPNHLHFPVAAAALRAGFHVLSDKPATRTLAEAEALADIVRDSGRLYGLTHTYLGYPLVAEMRDRIAQGTLGAVRKVFVEYPQGWLASEVEQASRQAQWRMDPLQSGGGGTIGDIGTHAFTLAEWVTGLQVDALCAELRSHVAGRTLDDDAAALLRFEGGASGVLVSSQVCAGEENALKLRVYGERGGLEWQQMEPNSLLFRPADAPMQIVRAGAGNSALGELASSRCRTPGGHPEGYIEAFANLYRDFAAAIRAGESGTAARVPGIELGLRGMRFIERMIESARAPWKWTAFELGGDAG